VRNGFWLNLRRFWRRSPLAFVSLIFLTFISLAAVSAPLITRHSYEEQNIERRLETPSRDYWMGTDTLGRDLYSRIVYGTRMSLAVGVCTALAALLLGTISGAVAGYYGGWTDRVVMRVVDLFYIFPSLLLAILLMILLGRGLTGILVAISLTAWVTQARLVRGQVLQARELAYVESARAMGLGHGRILFRHIVPNLWGPIIVSLTLQIPTNILSESFLSFLGLGLRPPFSSWGTLAAEGLRAMRYNPWLMIFPGGILFLTALAFNYLGDGLADWLDPRLGRRQSLD
jgi:oligopeptide transport system permease protein